tara:strand:+ start:619 stop:1665 length:1047 start_codon:yes stop_codon:yes gene_type:complete
MRYYEFIVEYKTEITKGRFGDKILDKLQIQDIIDLKPDIEAGRPMSKPTDYQQLALYIMGVGGRTSSPVSPWESVDQELFDKHKNEIVEKLIAQFEDFDPTANKQYMPYLLNWYVNSGEIGSYAFPNLEDARSTLKESLIMYYKLRERIPERYRDIGQYSSASDFMNSVQALQSQYGKQEKLDPGDTEVIYDSKYATIYWAKDEEGSCYLGQGTQWCTAATRSTNYFDRYNKDGPLIIINMKEKIRTYDGWRIDDDGGEHEDPDGERVVNKIQAAMDVEPDDTGALFWTWEDIADPTDEPVDFSTLYDDNPNFKQMWDSPKFQKAMDVLCRKWWDYNGLHLASQVKDD